VIVGIGGRCALAKKKAREERTKTTRAMVNTEPTKRHVNVATDETDLDCHNTGLLCVLPPSTDRETGA